MDLALLERELPDEVTSCYSFSLSSLPPPPQDDKPILIDQGIP